MKKTEKKTTGKPAAPGAGAQAPIDGAPEAAFRPTADTERAFRQLTSTIGGGIGTILEYIWNAYQWGRAKHIWIIVEGRGQAYTLTILDDGIGMNEYRRHRSMNLAMAPREEERGGRNWMNLGMKRAGADFAFCHIETISKDDTDGRMRKWEFSWDNLFSLLAGKGGTEIVPKAVVENATCWGLPAGSTGTRIHLLGSRERPASPRYMAETLIETLGGNLTPRIADTVYVNGLPLKKRVLVKDPVRWEHNHPVLGKLVVDLYVPKVKSPRDELKIGAAEAPVCSWQVFRKEVPPDQWRDSLRILEDGVYGDISVDAFAEKVASNRQSFEGELFTSQLLEEFLTYLELQVQPAVKNLLGVIEEAEESRFEQRLLEDLARYCGGVREGPPDPTPKSVLRVEPSEIELLPNQTVAIEVTQYHPDLTIVWDEAGAGDGRITERRDHGRKITFRAGPQFGDYVLRCFYAEERETCRSVDLSVVSRKVLQVSPPRARVVFGGVKALEAVNWREEGIDEAELEWTLDSDDTDGCFLVATRRGKEHESPVAYGSVARYQAGTESTTYRIKVSGAVSESGEKGKQQPKRTVEAFGDITVGDAPTPAPKGRGRMFVIEGHRYQVMFIKAEGATWLSRLSTALVPGESDQVTLNRLHPEFQDAKALGYAPAFVVAKSQLVLQHIDRTADGDLAPADRTQRFAEITALMVENLQEG